MRIEKRFSILDFPCTVQLFNESPGVNIENEIIHYLNDLIKDEDADGFEVTSIDIKQVDKPTGFSCKNILLVTIFYNLVYETIQP